jgi:hypothetical protein
MKSDGDVKEPGQALSSGGILLNKRNGVLNGLNFFSSIIM